MEADSCRRFCANPVIKKKKKKKREQGNCAVVVWRAVEGWTLGSLSKDDGYGYGNATKQEYYWLKEDKYTCCTCNTHFRAFFCRTPQNNNLKSPNFRFLRQREHKTMNQSFSVLTLRPFVPIQLQHNSTVLYKVNKRE